MVEKIRMDKVDHLCVIVENIERTIERVKEIFDVPHFKVDESTSTARINGKEIGRYKLKTAFLKISENMTLELLEISEGNSVELDWLHKHGESLHHIAILATDLEKEASKWEKKGVRILQEDHGKWIYLDTEKILGMNLELVNPAVLP